MLLCDAPATAEDPRSQARRVSLYPLTFAPVFKRYTWGGRKLARIAGRDAPEGRVAESWEVSAHPRGPTPVANGPLAGQLLSELLERYGEALVGRRNREAISRRRFPLLIKLLDANEWLSVQVHPGDEYALRHEGDLGKTEMWVVLQADPGAELIFGLDARTDAAALRRALAEGRLEALLHRLPARAGDVFFVPAGTVHALGPGLLLAEIQQSSDTTYRLYDWGRDPAGATPRPLHIEQALAVVDFSSIRPGRAEPETRSRDGGSVEILASCPSFETWRLSLAAGESYSGRCDGETLELWCALAGGADFRWRGEAVAGAALQWVLLPAGLGDFEVRATADSSLLRVFTPEPPVTGSG